MPGRVPLSPYCDRLLSSYDSVDQLLVEDLRRLLAEAGVPASRAEECLERVALMLSKTAHVSKARSVAYMMGFCRYLARLVEAYGVSIAYSGVVPGKGRLAHKILALASMEVFGDWRGPGGLESRVRRAVAEASALIEEIEAQEGLVPRSALLGRGDAVGEAHAAELEEAGAEYRRRVEEAEAAAARLLLQLAGSYEALTRHLRLSPSRLRPLAESQMVDYGLHVIGTPDLILEDEDSGRAIVVEWKTYESTPQAWEMAQAYVYAMMEAARLGYGAGGLGAYRRPGTLRELAAAIAETDPGSAAVVPIVVRPATRAAAFYSTHPALKPLQPRVEPADPCAVLHLAAVSSLHLALLISYDPDAREACQVEAGKVGVPGEKTVAAYRVTPPTLRDREVRRLAKMPSHLAGRPAAQDSHPCTLCARLFPPVPPACRRYFASHEETPLERMIFRYRMAALEEHESDMMVYKALYSAGLERLWEAFRECRPLEYKPEERLPLKTLPGRGCAVKAGGSLYRYAFFDEVEVRDKPYYGDALVLRLRDAGRLQERVELKGFGEAVRIHAPREGKPIAVYLASARRPRPPTLNVNVFARVEEVSLEDGGLVVRAGLPSPSLRFSLALFARLLRLLGCPAEGDVVRCGPRELGRLGLRPLAAEVVVDLTYIDLRLLDLVYRNLLASGEEAAEVEDNLTRLFDEVYTGVAEWG